MKEFEISQPLKAAHFDFPRAQVLRQAFVRCVTDYYTKATREGSEARGLIITGHSRVGKSQETEPPRFHRRPISRFYATISSVFKFA